MKTALIIAAIVVFLVYGFVLYCCIKVGKESDFTLENFQKGSETDCRMWKGYGQSVKGGNDKISCEDGAGETTATAGAETE